MHRTYKCTSALIIISFVKGFGNSLCAKKNETIIWPVGTLRNHSHTYKNTVEVTRKYIIDVFDNEDNHTIDKQLG